MHAGEATKPGSLRALLLAVALLAGGRAIAVETLPVRELAAGVFVHAGVQEEMSPGNLGGVANIGFVVGARCVAVIDSGGSVAVGRALLAAIRVRTLLPVCYVINTHVHPDHIFGNAAFRTERPEFVGHSRLAAAMASRGPNYLRALLRDLGTPAIGSELIAPSREVRDTLDLDLGGRILRLTAWSTAHTDNDLTVLDLETGTLWLSDLLFVDRIPVVDGSLRGWLAAISRLRQMRPEHVVPGHGPLDAPWPQVLEAQARYLSGLADDVRRALRERRTLQQAVDTVGAAEREHWLLFSSFHRRNVTAAYAELEWEE